MTKNHRNLALLSLIGIMTLSPFFSYAKEKDREDEDKKGNRPESQQVERHLCLKAFGHLIAPGYIKNKGRVSFFGDCFLPFGIRKKLGNRASSTPDTIAPVIKNVAVLMGTTTASVSWKTNENASSTLYYGTSSPLDVSASSTASVSDNNFKKSHLVSLSGLQASTTYLFVIGLSDQSGNTTTTSAFTAVTH